MLSPLSSDLDILMKSEVTFVHVCLYTCTLVTFNLTEIVIVHMSIPDCLTNHFKTKFLCHFLGTETKIYRFTNMYFS